MTYRYETHVHTSEVSTCGHVQAADVVRLYVQSGYSGIIVTDHLNRSTFREMPDASWDEMVTYYLRGYRAAEAAAAALDPAFRVLLGLELRLDTLDDNDFLVFGADEDFLRRSETLMEMTVEEMSAYVHENGLLLFQAHPFRSNMTIVDWNLLDGIEVYNGNPNHESNNPIAALWAKRHALAESSGTDYHGDMSEHPGGICTSEPIRDNAHLLEILRSGQYTLLYKEDLLP